MTNKRPITAIDVRKCLLATGRNPNHYDEQALTDRCEGVDWADLELFVGNHAYQYLRQDEVRTECDCPQCRG